MLFGVLLIPYYLKFISADVFGAWLASGSIAYWVVVINPGLTEIIQQQIAFNKGNGDKEQLIRVMESCIGLSIFVSVVVLVVGTVLSANILEILNIDNSFAIVEDAFFITIVTVSLTFLSQSLLGILNGLHFSFYVGLFNVISYVLSVVATIVLLNSGYGLMAIAYAALIRVGVLTALNVFFCFFCWWSSSFRRLFPLSRMAKLRDIKQSLDMVFFKVLSYSFVARVFSVLTGNAESFLLARYFGVSTVTPIIITKKVPDLIVSFLTRPTYAMTPSIAVMKGTGHLASIKPLLLNTFYVVLWLSAIGLSVVLVFNDDIITFWLDESFFAGHSMNLAICFSALMSILFQVFSEINIALGDVKQNAKVSIVQGILFFPTVAVCGYMFGPIGIVLAIGINRLMVSNWYFLIRVFNSFSYDHNERRALIREACITSLISIVLFLVFRWLDVPSLTWLIVFLSVHLFLFALLLLILSEGFDNLVRKHFVAILGAFKSS